MKSGHKQTMTYKRISRSLESSKVKSWRALMGAFNTILRRLEKGLMAEGCSLSRFQIMFHLYMEAELPAAELARRLFVTRGNISMFLKRMESDQLISREFPDGQKRPVYYLTDHGIAFFEKIIPGHIRRVQKHAPRLNQNTIKLLGKVKDSD